MNYTTILKTVCLSAMISFQSLAQENSLINYLENDTFEVEFVDYKSAVIELLRNEMSTEDIIQAYLYLGITDSTYINSIPSINPLEVQERPFITSHYGYRYHPVKRKYLKHQGIDLVCKKGFQFIYATADGIVTKSGYNGGLGLSVTLQHPSGFETIYGHMSGIYVRVDREVKIGSVIGVMGATGVATAVHLHYSIKKNGVYLNPLPYLTLYQDFKQKRDALKASLSSATTR